MDIRGISRSTLTRLPAYLAYLRKLPKDGSEHISAGVIAGALGLSEVQVRKDLASVSTAGRPKVGYEIRTLIDELEKFLGESETVGVVVVGAGRLGKALMDYEGFASYGVEIVAGFDTVPSGSYRGRPILAMSRMADFCREHGIRLGILTVPASAAQQACDQMVLSGIEAILNLTAVKLKTPDHVLVHNENIAVSLAMLSDHLERRQK